MLIDVIWPVQNPKDFRLIVEAFNEQSVEEFGLHILDMSGELGDEPTPDNVHIHYVAGNSLSDAKNIGLTMCKSPRVLMHSDGCLPVPNHVESHLVYGSRLVVCYGSYHVVESLEDLSVYLPDPRILQDRMGFLSGVVSGKEPWRFAAGCSSYPRKVVMGLGGFRSLSLKHLDEAELARRCVEVGCEVRLLPHAGVYGINVPALDEEAICEAEAHPLHHAGLLSVI